jgi:nitrite reductase (NADH) large subunit
MLRGRIEELGVQVHTGKNTVEIVDGAGCAPPHGVRRRHATSRPTCWCSRPASARATNSPAQSGWRRRRAAASPSTTTPHQRPDIYAIGECAAWNGQVFGLVAPGYDMARVAAKHLAGQPAAFTGADMSTKLKLMGVDVASIGDAQGRTAGSRAFQYIDERKQIYKKIVVSGLRQEAAGRGAGGRCGRIRHLAADGAERHRAAGRPRVPDPAAAPTASRARLGVDALPDTAQICSCNDVSKGRLCEAVSGGATTIGALKACTKAGTACGGCVPLVTQVMKAQMKKQGLAVNNHLCEHFAHSRQELFHLVKVEGIRTFDALLGRHGKGLGCDICKPVAASIFASCWNDFVLKREHAALQDSNDYFLGNIQKDGTYSVVPRMPGGEVTPDGLMAVARSPRTTACTPRSPAASGSTCSAPASTSCPPSGNELIAAGFESGHAYGKSLRTVKSCVGSTWCRYGVADSVGLAIELENRYKGLRAPHKIKFGVSGCTRECAEAQGKDVGVIATDKGWNLYVCGNGGMKPRHAELLASGPHQGPAAGLHRPLPDVLHPHRRPAAAHQRLARQPGRRAGLPEGRGGARQRWASPADLQADMQRVVDTYQCEWKTAVTNPETRKRFRQFVNSDQPDANVVFVQERGQIRPATLEERTARPAPACRPAA